MRTLRIKNKNPTWQTMIQHEIWPLSALHIQNQAVWTPAECNAVPQWQRGVLALVQGPITAAHMLGATLMLKLARVKIWANLETWIHYDSTSCCETCPSFHNYLRAVRSWVRFQVEALLWRNDSIWVLLACNIAQIAKFDSFMSGIQNLVGEKNALISFLKL